MRNGFHKIHLFENFDYNEDFMNFELLHQKIKEKSLVISLFGLGRIGLPTAIEFAAHGYRVIGVDINTQLLQDLQKSKTFIDEPDLDKMLKDCNDKKRLEYTEDGLYAVKNSDIVILCLPTPVSMDKIPDYSIIESVAHRIGKEIKVNQIIIYESSVSPTTIERMIVPILEKESNKKINIDFGVCACPERADPGKIIDNFNKVARVIGGTSPEITSLVATLYRTITDAKLMEMSSPGTANAVKLTENIFRDVNIALMNEFAVLYEMLGIDIKEVIEGCKTKYNFIAHNPGPGVGGPCLPANPYYIIKDAVKVNYIPFLIRVAREVNDRMPDHVKDLIILALNKAGLSINQTQIAILGVSYKANVRDIQISPSLKVIEYLSQIGANLKIYDPYYAGEKIGAFEISKTLDETISKSKAIAVLTDHKEFLKIDWGSIAQKMGQLILIDSRNIYDINQLPKKTLYCGVGRFLREI